MLIRASTRRCRSFAAAYSAFSRRSPSSRARLISFGSSSFSSWFSVAISSSNFLISRSFMDYRRRKAGWYHSAMLFSGSDRSALAMLRDKPLAGPTLTSRRNPIVARYRAAADGKLEDLLLLDGAHLVADALAAGVTIEHAVVAADASETADIQPLLAQLPSRS